MLNRIREVQNECTNEPVLCVCVCVYVCVCVCACVCVCVCVCVICFARQTLREYKQCSPSASLFSITYNTQKHRHTNTTRSLTHTYAHERESKRERTKEKRCLQNNIKPAGKSAKSGPKSKQKHQNKHKISSRRTIDDEHDPIVAVLAPYRGTAKQAWFRGLDSDMRDAVIAMWLDTFRFPGRANNQK
jgi:hypothetical protein